jgi:DNA-binding transcriptional ArsR family regulator
VRAEGARLGKLAQTATFPFDGTWLDFTPPPEWTPARLPLGLTQPQVSKHLRVLREVGLVQVRDAGRQRLYRLDPEPLKAIHDWLSPYDFGLDGLARAA